MKQGLMLIEVVIGIALASIMTILLYQAFAQTRASVSRTDQLIDYNSMLALVYNQLDKDITGMVSMTREEKDTKDKKTSSFSATPENVFSFITTNALAVYHKQTVRPVRVVYRLQKTPAGILSLVRQEGEWKLTLKDFDDTKKYPAYELIAGLTKLSARFSLPKDEQSKEWITFNKWTEEEQNSTKHSLPKFIEFEGIWLNQQENQEYPFSFSFLIPFEEAPKKEAQKTPQAPPAHAPITKTTSKSRLTL